MAITTGAHVENPRLEFFRRALAQVDQRSRLRRLPALRQFGNGRRTVALDLALELIGWDTGGAQRCLTLTLGEAGSIVGSILPSGFRDVSVLNVLVGATRGLDLLQQFAASPDRARLDAHRHQLQRFVFGR